MTRRHKDTGTWRTRTWQSKADETQTTWQRTKGQTRYIYTQGNHETRHSWGWEHRWHKSGEEQTIKTRQVKLDKTHAEHDYQSKTGNKTKTMTDYKIKLTKLNTTKTKKGVTGHRCNRQHREQNKNTTVSKTRHDTGGQWYQNKTRNNFTKTQDHDTNHSLFVGLLDCTLLY